MRLRDTIRVLLERREQLDISLPKSTIDILIDPGVEEFLGFLKRSAHGELRGLMMMIDPHQMGLITILWDANLADHVTVQAALRGQGLKLPERGSPHLEFTQNPGYGSHEVARHGMVAYGPVHGTRSKAFKESLLGMRLLRHRLSVTESHRPLPRLLYHATKKVNVDSILQNGLVPGQ